MLFDLMGGTLYCVGSMLVWEYYQGSRGGKARDPLPN